MLNVETHGLQNAFLGFFNGLAEAVHAREIIAVGVVTPALALNGYGIAVEGHARSKLTMKRRARWSPRCPKRTS